MNQLDAATHQLMIIGGIIFCIFGFIGNIFNICVFQMWSRSPRMNNNTRTSNSPLYLLIIGYPLITRILFDGYEYPVTRKNVFLLCKLRYYVLHSVDLISLICVYLATFDRYLISSRNVHLRQMSKTQKTTKIIIYSLVCLVVFHSIPLLIYYDVSDIDQCFVNSTIYLIYYRYVIQILLHGIIFFSLFAYFISFFHIISSLLFYTNSVCSFYISTPNFRRQIRKIL